jgi:hypothetical protein
VSVFTWIKRVLKMTLDNHGPTPKLWFFAFWRGEESHEVVFLSQDPDPTFRRTFRDQDLDSVPDEELIIPVGLKVIPFTWGKEFSGWVARPDSLIGFGDYVKASKEFMAQMYESDDGEGADEHGVNS